MAGIDELEEDADANAMVRHLVGAHGKILTDRRSTRDTTAKEGDSESEDMVIASIRIHEKTG